MTEDASAEQQEEIGVAIASNRLFQSPDIPTAATYGMLMLEQDQPQLGTRYFMYQEQHLESALWDTLNEVQSDFNLPLELSVSRLSHICLDEISDLCRRAVREYRLKLETTASNGPFFQTPKADDGRTGLSRQNRGGPRNYRRET